MTLSKLARARILILGLGREGLETYKFLRAEFPEKPLGLADRLPIDRLAPEVQSAMAMDANLVTNLGDGYLSTLTSYDVVVRSPGVPLKIARDCGGAKRGRADHLAYRDFSGELPGHHNRCHRDQGQEHDRVADRCGLLRAPAVWTRIC